MDDVAPLMNVDWIRWFASVQKAIETPVSINLEQITMTSPRLLGRTTAGTGAAEQISVAGNLTLSGGVLTGTAPTGAALTRVDDTNITLTLGGSPTVALLAATSLTLGWSGTLAATRGGTGLGSYAVGDILYASTTSALSRRAIGSAADVLTVSGGLPVWAAPAASGSSVITNDTTTNATMFLTWVTANTGSLPLKVTSTKLSFNPSTGVLALATALPVTSGGTGTGTAFTAGTVVFAGASGVYTSETNLFWDATNKRLGIKTGTSPTAALDINDGAGFRVRNGTTDGFDFVQSNTNQWDIQTLTAGSILRIVNADLIATRNVGAGSTATPTAKVHIAAGTAAANTAPFKFTSGTNLTTAEAGAMEYNGTNLFFTRAGTVRENVLVAIDNPAAPGTSIGVGIVNYYGSSATNFLGDPNRWLSVNVLGATYKIPLYT